MARIAIIGGGISGLCAAVNLADNHEVFLLESGPRLGGKLRSHRLAGAVVEASANGLLDDEPAVGRLIERLGLEDRVLVAQPGPRFVFHGGKLCAVPMSPQALLGGTFLSPAARGRLLTEPFRFRGPEDESIADFIRRRLGPEILEKLVAPFVTGIHAGDVEALSISSCFPRLKEMERSHGSLLAGLIKRKKGPGKLITFQGGLSTLVQALEDSLGSRARVGVHCPRLDRRAQGWFLEGAPRPFDAVVLACPAKASAALLRGLEPDAADALDSIEHVSMAVVAGVLPTSDWTPPEGFGCLVPQGPDAPRALGVLLTTNVFPDHGVEGHATMRIMMGGARDAHVLEASDAELVTRARTSTERIFGPLPPFSAKQVFRYPSSIPQYTLGHEGRVAHCRAAESRQPGLFLLGSHLKGIAVKDCIRAGEDLAARVGSTG